MPFVEMQDVRRTTFEGRAFAVGWADGCWHIIDVDAAEAIGGLEPDAAGRLRAFASFKIGEVSAAVGLTKAADDAEARVRRIGIAAGLDVAPSRAELH